MNSFQRTVLIIASVLLILCLIVIGIALQGNFSSEVFPPVIAKCPDYWESTEKGCINTYDLGYNIAVCKNVDIDQMTSDCEKQKWARGCNLTWDGITNSSDLCGI